MTSPFKRAASSRVRGARSDRQDPNETNFQRYFILRPDSMRRLIWDFLSLLMVTHDVVSLPLEVFDLPSTFVEFMIIMDWVVTFFWTIDIPVSLTTGFHAEGCVEIRPRKIAARYVKKRLPFDGTIVIIDWLLVFLTLVDEKGSGYGTALLSRVTNIFRSFRVSRALRIFRLLRCANFYHAAFRVSVRVKSEVMREIASICAKITLIVLVSHYLACGWYVVGELARAHGYLHDSWLLAHELEEKGFGYSYTTALHWALTQFTPSSTDVHAYNTPERIYSVCVLLFGLVAFSSFVSSITASMTTLRKLQSGSGRAEAILRNYFIENNISTELGQIIWKFLWSTHFSHQKTVLERDVADIVALLPRSLRAKLREELFLPVLVTLPFFRVFSSLSSQGAQAVCHESLREICMVTCEEQFGPGSRAESMYIVTAGVVNYFLGHNSDPDQDPRSTGGDILAVGTWVVEPALWMLWTHQGRLVARTSCEFVELNATSFRVNVMSHSSPAALDFLMCYARCFADHMTNRVGGWRTDLWNDLRLLNSIAQQSSTNSHSEQRWSFDGGESESLSSSTTRRIDRSLTIRHQPTGESIRKESL